MYIDFKKNCKEYLKEAKKKGYQKYGFVEFQEFRGIVITSLQKLNNPLEELLYYKFVYQKKGDEILSYCNRTKRSSHIWNSYFEFLYDSGFYVGRT